MEHKTYEGYFKDGVFYTADGKVPDCSNVKVMVTLLEEPKKPKTFCFDEWQANMDILREEAEDEELPEDLLELLRPRMERTVLESMRFLKQIKDSPTPSEKKLLEEVEQMWKEIKGDS